MPRNVAVTLALAFGMTAACSRNESRRDSTVATPHQQTSASSDGDPQTVIRREDDPPVRRVDSDDPEMQQAIDQARATVDEFIAVLRKPRVPKTFASIKAPFREGDQVEHVAGPCSLRRVEIPRDRGERTSESEECGSQRRGAG